MKVNRFGKKIYELGYKSIREFVETNNIKASTDLIHRWSTQGCAPYEVHAETLNKITGIFDCSRTDLLNMIASNPTFEIKGGNELPKADADNLLKQKRYDLGFTAAEMAEYIGINDRQVIIDIENGKRAKFPVGKEEAFKKYLDALDISFGQFTKALTNIREKHLKNTKVVTIKPDIAEKLYQDMNGEIVPDEAFKEAMSKPIPLTACDPSEYPSVPCKAPSLPLDTDKINTVMSLIYGQVDYEVYKEVENILKGVI